MQKAESTLFGPLKKRYAVYIIAYSVLLAFAYSFTGLRLTQLFVLANIGASLVINPFLGLGLYMSSELYMSELFPAYISVGIFGGVIASLFLHNIRIVRHLRYWKLLFLSLFLVFVSYVTGYKPSSNIALLQCLCILMFVMIANYEQSGLCVYRSLVWWGFFAGAVGMLVYILLSLVRHHSVTVYGRLCFEGNIKGLTIAFAIPLLLICVSRIEHIDLFGRKFPLSLEIIFVAAFSVCFVLTLARGSMIAFLVAFLYAVLRSPRKVGVFGFIPLVIVLLLALSYFSKLDIFRLDRIFKVEEYYSANGRTDIWANYISKMRDHGILRIIFGVGPGEVSRISNIGVYAHSTIMDYYFSYGIVGIAVFIYYEFKVIMYSLKSGRVVLFSLVIMLIIIYAGHGSAANSMLYITQAMVMLEIRSASSSGVRNE